jgi:hypothetical protein
MSIMTQIYCVHKAREETPRKAGSCVKGGNVRIRLDQTFHINYVGITTVTLSSMSPEIVKLISKTVLIKLRHRKSCIETNERPVNIKTCHE